MDCIGVRVIKWNMMLGVVSYRFPSVSFVRGHLADMVELNPGGAQTWNWNEMSKYMKKVSFATEEKRMSLGFEADQFQCETYTAPSAAVRQTFGNVVDANAGGKTGPIQVSVTNYIYPIVANWVP